MKKKVKTVLSVRKRTVELIQELLFVRDEAKALQSSKRQTLPH